MDEVRGRWEVLRLTLIQAQAASEALSAALLEAKPDTDRPWDSASRMAWRSWWDKYSELDYDLWQAYCHGFQAPVWAEFDLD